MPYTYVYKTLNTTGGGGSAENSEYAEKAGSLKFPRKIEITGDAAGSALFDGSKDIDIEVSVSAITKEELEAILA